MESSNGKFETVSSNSWRFRKASEDIGRNPLLNFSGILAFSFTVLFTSFWKSRFATIFLEWILASLDSKEHLPDVLQRQDKQKETYKVCIYTYTPMFCFFQFLVSPVVIYKNREK